MASIPVGGVVKLVRRQRTTRDRSLETHWHLWSVKGEASQRRHADTVKHLIHDSKGPIDIYQPQFPAKFHREASITVLPTRRTTPLHKPARPNLETIAISSETVSQASIESIASKKDPKYLLYSSYCHPAATRDRKPPHPAPTIDDKFQAANGGGGIILAP